MKDKTTLEKGISDSKEIVDKSVEKGKNVAGRVANDFSKTVDDLLVGMKSVQKDMDSKITQYKETTPNRIDLDLIDDGNVMYVKADLPGVKKEDIDVEIMEKELTIKGYFGSKCEDDGENCSNSECEFLIKGRKFGPAERTIKLPTKIKIGDSKAEFENGVLFLELPKVEVKKLKVNIK